MNTDTSTSVPLLVRAVRAARIAFAFLTVVPVRLRDEETESADLAASRFAYPLVGGVIGLALAGLSELLGHAGTAPALAAFLLVGFGVLISGGLHLDGLADSCDGLFLWGTPERRLAAMRDPHVGSFGVMAIVLVIVGKYAALGTLVDGGRSRAVLASALISRTLILVSAGLARYARPEGTGRFVVEASTRRDAGLAAIVILGCGAAVCGWVGLVAAAMSLVLALAWTRCAGRSIGGITGDTLGALVELGELVVLFVLGLCHF